MVSTRYRFSSTLYAPYAAELDPARSRRHLTLSGFMDDHVIFSHAILAAYGVIEDLGLEVRASREQPSMTNGEWNPVVKDELEKRLRSAGVSLEEPVLWTIRGSRTRIHRKRPIRIQALAPWAGGPIVRDGQAALVDGIAYASWLRSTIAAHAGKRLTPSLSPYDVVNVQHVARRLIIEVIMGRWRRWWEPPR